MLFGPIPARRSKGANRVVTEPKTPGRPLRREITGNTTEPRTPACANDLLKRATLVAAGDLLDLRVRGGDQWTKLSVDELGVRVSRPASLTDLDAIERAGLVLVERSRIEFLHPLVRSAVYQAATFAERRRVHLSLAEAIGDSDDHRRTWHRTAAAGYPDESVADALESLGSGTAASRVGCRDDCLRPCRRADG